MDPPPSFCAAFCLLPVGVAVAELVGAFPVVLLVVWAEVGAALALFPEAVGVAVPV